ncbi:hypothetical protein E4U13_002051 [Claviceps humidiphila]|uniref:Clr5 domain-containing protein n=1 Tax=Claviceps humidiphila TaxID=1294629 RepID=A0A9P7Q0I6_9HYPO|nr:hypothetical protein E4U13_002051 [Claviceps humidiphila]
MFNFSPGKPTASAFNPNPHGLASWPIFDIADDGALSLDSQAEQTHGGKLASHHGGGMDWMQTSSSAQNDGHHSNNNRHSNQGCTDTELEALLHQSHRGERGVELGRSAAHFENKGYDPFEQKSFVPTRLPSRPIYTAVSNTSSFDRQQHQHSLDLECSSVGMNSFRSNIGFDPLPLCGSSGGPVSPITIADEAWGSFDSMQRMTSPVSISPPPWSYGSFQEHGLASPFAMSSSGQFGSLDNFMATNRIRSSIAQSPMSNSHLVPSPTILSAVNSVSHAVPAVGGNPGFETWRSPGAISARINQSPPDGFNTNSNGDSGSNNTTASIIGIRDFHNRNRVFDRDNDLHAMPFHLENNNLDSPATSACSLKPSASKPPKTNINVDDQQFVLEMSPNTIVKGKVPARPHRQKASLPSLNTSSLAPQVKQEPATPKPSDVPLASSAPESSFFMLDQKPGSIALRSQMGIRPSREQVPAEAWEQFKGTIRTLYLEERKPLKEVMSIMAERFGFQATPKMYKTRFSQWGFVKNNTEDEVKRLLSKKFQRDAEGKVSEFVRNGRVVNLGTYLKRKGVTEYDLVDFELSADLPAHVRCRTPTPPPTPGYLRSPDLLRAQELIVGNMRKTFLHCRQCEVETDARIDWPVIMVWGAGSSDLLLEANVYFEARDADKGGSFMMKAFKQLEQDLKQISPLGIMELLLGMVHRDPGMMTALCKYLAAYSTTNFERSHPLRQIFTCLYDVQQKHGASTVSEILWGGVPTIAEELEAIYSRRHPYVARTWIDLALFYNYVNADRFDKLVPELRLQQRQVEARFGPNSPNALTLRYAITQSLYAANPHSEATRHAAHEMWNQLTSVGVVFGIRDAKPNSYCYHSPVKVDPWTKRCRRQYDSGVSILEEHVGVRIQPYFAEDYHHCVHVSDTQEAWSAAFDYVGSGKFVF